jgi:hypothetical protein
MRTRSLAVITAAAISVAGGLLMSAPAAMAKPQHKGNPIAVAAAPRWRDVSPRPPILDGPEALSCAGPRTCLAVGVLASPGTPGSVTWNGTRWSSRIAPTPSADLGAVSCVKASFCMAVGGSTRDASTVAERWNGSRWIVEKTPSFPEFAALIGVSCSSPNSCTAVGWHVKNTTTYLTLAEHWSGKSWKIQPTPSLIELPTLSDVSCPAARSCVAVGNSAHRMFAEIWNGTSWSLRVIHPPKGAIFGTVDAVSCSSPDACTAVGLYGNGSGYNLPLAERWNGTSWRRQLAAVPAGGLGSELDKVSCASARSCVALGVHDIRPMTSRTIAEVWTGRKWVVQGLRGPEYSAVNNAGSLSCSTAVNCMAAGALALKNAHMWAEHYS